MKTIILLCLIVGSGFSSSLRARRDVTQFGQMIECVTPRSALSDYNGYGCWCGYGGSGNPVDDTDGCCKTHDECYDALSNGGTCSSTQLYFESYSFSCYSCDTSSADISCGSQAGSSSSCRAGLCECDMAAAFCFRSETFNAANRNYNKDNC